MGAAAAQTEPPLTPDSAPEIKAGTAVQLPGTSGELKAPEEPIGKAKPSLVKPGNTNPIAGAMAPSIPESATGKPALETPSPAPTSPANEPSVLPPTNVPFVAEPPAAEAEVPLKLPDIGPGSMSQPLLSGSQVDEPILELQPVPVMELSLFFGAVLLLAIGYLSFTARYTEPEDSPGNTPKSSLPR